MNKKLFNEYIDCKIAQQEEITGENLNATERDIYLGSFIVRMCNFANKYDFEVMAIFDNFDLMCELDELIDYDESMAVKKATEALMR